MEIINYLTHILSFALGTVAGFLIIKYWKKKYYTLKSMRRLIFNAGKNLKSAMHDMKVMEQVLMEIEVDLNK